MPTDIWYLHAVVPGALESHMTSSLFQIPAKIGISQ
jgi:hypothetical protein